MALAVSRKSQSTGNYDSKDRDKEDEKIRLEPVAGQTTSSCNPTKNEQTDAKFNLR